MLTMFAETYQNGEWRKVGNIFKSTYDELDSQSTDRVYDGYDLSFIQFLQSQCYGGVPEGLSAELKAHPFFQDTALWHATLQDLLMFDWDIVECKTGYISEWQYARLKKDGLKPINILDKLYNKEAIVVNNFMMGLLIDYPNLHDGRKYYTTYKYNKQTYSSKYAFFCNKSIPALIHLIPYGGTAADVRIIFSNK